MKINAMHYIMIVVYTMVILFMATRQPDIKDVPATTPSSYQYSEPTDWAKDSTVAYEKKQYCEYLFNKK